MYALWDWVQSLPGYGPLLAWGLFGGLSLIHI